MTIKSFKKGRHFIYVLLGVALFFTSCIDKEEEKMTEHREDKCLPPSQKHIAPAIHSLVMANPKLPSKYEAPDVTPTPDSLQDFQLNVTRMPSFIDRNCPKCRYKSYIHNIDIVSTRVPVVSGTKKYLPLRPQSLGRTTLTLRQLLPSGNLRRTARSNVLVSAQEIACNGECNATSVHEDALLRGPSRLIFNSLSQYEINSPTGDEEEATGVWGGVCWDSDKIQGTFGQDNCDASKHDLCLYVQEANVSADTTNITPVGGITTQHCVYFKGLQNKDRLFLHLVEELDSHTQNNLSLDCQKTADISTQQDAQHRQKKPFSLSVVVGEDTFQNTSGCRGGKHACFTAEVMSLNAIGLPGRPTGLQTQLTTNQMVVSWQAANKAIEHCVQYKKSEDSNWTDVNDTCHLMTNTSPTTYTHTGPFEAGKTYQYRVYGKNDQGAGEVSEMASLRISGAVVTNPARRTAPSSIESE